MGEKTKDHYYKVSSTRKLARLILFSFAALAWIGALTYLGLSHNNPLLPVDWKVFGLLLTSILIFLIPALLLSWPKNPRSPYRILIAFVLTLVAMYWIFSPLYEFLALYEHNRPGIRLLATNYIWEVPIIGTITALFLYHYFLKLLKNLHAQKEDNAAFVKARLKFMRLPIVAFWVMIGIALVGDLIGLPIARAKLMPPWRELIKEAININTVGVIGGVLFFFILIQLLRPWLETDTKKGDPQV